MITGSVISDMTRNVPPHSGHTVTSNSNARLSGALHDEAADNDDKTTRVHKLIGYFSQPFRISEPFRGTPGESVARDQVLSELEAILNGELG